MVPVLEPHIPCGGNLQTDLAYTFLVKWVDCYENTVFKHAELLPQAAHTQEVILVYPIKINLHLFLPYDSPDTSLAHQEPK